MIKIKTKGDFKKFNSFMERAKEVFNVGVLNKYGEMGVEELQKATPKSSGLTSKSWYYEITHTKDSATISFCNSNIQYGQNIAIILQNGHATKNGYWVEGVDYINPALEPVFRKIAEDALKEATRK